MSDTETKIHLVTNFARIPEKPKVRIWHWIQYYLFNLYRKPLVWKKQYLLRKINIELISDMNRDIQPYVDFSCAECIKTWGILKCQVFTSQMALILKGAACESHGDLFNSFYALNKTKFDQSEEISAWINGFR